MQIILWWYSSTEEGEQYTNYLFACIFLCQFRLNVARLIPFRFFFGNSNENGADYFMDEEVVFVTINYRLSALG